jgi:hypothetical protein
MKIRRKEPTATMTMESKREIQGKEKKKERETQDSMTKV